MLAIKNYKNKNLLYIFIIIVLLHVALLWLLFKKNTLHNIKEYNTIDKELDRDKQWVALQGSHSAPVIFKTISTSPTPLNQPHIDQQSKSFLPIKQQEPEQKNEPSIASKPPVITQNNSYVSIVNASENKHEDAMDPQQKIISQKETPSNNEKQPTTTQKKPQFSFNNLVQGLAHHFQEEQGTDTYTMRGKNVGKATAEQIRYAQYGTKICSTIHNAFLTNNTKNSITIRNNDPLVVKIIINKDGSLQNTHIIKTSHSQSIDQTVISIINSAAHSFPPLPEFFGMQQCPFVITINNALQVIERPELSYWSL